MTATGNGHTAYSGRWSGETGTTLSYAKEDSTLAPGPPHAVYAVFINAAQLDTRSVDALGTPADYGIYVATKSQTRVPL